jgi:hypothetical protein
MIIGLTFGRLNSLEMFDLARRTLEKRHSEVLGDVLEARNLVGARSLKAEDR